MRQPVVHAMLDANQVSFFLCLFSNISCADSHIADIVFVDNPYFCFMPNKVIMGSIGSMIV